MNRNYILTIFSAETKRGAGLLPIRASTPKEARSMAQMYVGDNFTVHECILRSVYEKKIRRFAFGKFIEDAMWRPHWTYKLP